MRMCCSGMCLLQGSVATEVNLLQAGWVSAAEGCVYLPQGCVSAAGVCTWGWDYATVAGMCSCCWCVQSLQWVLAAVGMCN